MSERKFSTLEQANFVADLMRKMSVRGVSVVPQDDHWVIEIASGSMSIIEVTEELLRQVGR